MSILLAGNSHALMILDQIAAVFERKYRTLDVLHRGACFPIGLQYDMPREEKPPCSEFAKQVLRLVTDVRYDVVFVNTW